MYGWCTVDSNQHLPAYQQRLFPDGHTAPADKHTVSHKKQLGASTHAIRDHLGHESEAITEHSLELLQRADNPYAEMLAALQGYNHFDSTPRHSF